MKATEAAALLTIAAAYDNRKPDADQARAWAMVLDGLRFEDCRNAIVAHYRTSREWMMPADIVAGVSKIRVARWETYYRAHGHLSPPARFADDPAAESRWIAEAMEGIRAGTITHPNQIDGYPVVEAAAHNVVAELGLVGRRIPREQVHPTTTPRTDTPHTETKETTR